MSVLYRYDRYQKTRQAEYATLLEAAKGAVQHSREEFCAFLSLSDGVKTFRDLRQGENFIEETELLTERQALFAQALAEQDLEQKNLLIRRIAEHFTIALEAEV